MIMLESATVLQKDLQKKSPTFIPYRRMGPGFYSWAKGADSSSFQAAIDDLVILGMRNQLLFKNINSQFSSGRKAVIVPWGIIHQKGLEKILADNKITFQKKEIAKVDVGECLGFTKDKKTNKLRKGFIGTFCISHMKDMLSGKNYTP